jgi:hypothetical protein
MSDINFKVIIIPHKGDDIVGQFEFEPGYDFPAEKIVDLSDRGKNNYVLFHFPQRNNREQMSNGITTLSEKIGGKNPKKKEIIILPISKDCNQQSDNGCQNARKLYNLCKDSQEKREGITIDKLQSYVEYWGKKAKEESKAEKKNNIMNSVLPFCIHCKNASLWLSNEKDFDKNFKEREEHIKDSLVIARKILMAEKDVWEDSQFKDTLEEITNLVEPESKDQDKYKLKESDTKAFIRQIIVEVEPEKTPGFIKLLKNLKDWVDRDNVQKQQDCCR